MNKKVGIIVLFVLIIVVLVGVTFLGLKRAKQVVVLKKQVPVAAVTPKSSSQTTKTENIVGTVKDLLTANATKTCTYSHQVSGTTVSGTIYLNAGKMRGDFSTTTSGATVKQHVVINDSTTMYAWSESSNLGIKIPLSTTNAEAVARKQNFNLDESVQFVCQGWTPDQSFFVVPSNITFYSYGNSGSTGK